MGTILYIVFGVFNAIKCDMINHVNFLKLWKTINIKQNIINYLINVTYYFTFNSGGLLENNAKAPSLHARMADFF